VAPNTVPAAEAGRKLPASGICLRESKPRNIISAPFIYAMIIPFLFVDLSISIYQLICFSLYRIGKVDRRKYIVIDRHQLSYLNSVEKLNCVYCGYINGLIAYSREIVSRTEQYWCPVKHARRLGSIHSRYHKFLEYGDGREYQERVAEIRRDFDDLREGK